MKNNEVTINGLENLSISSLEIVNMAGATVKSYDNVNTPSFNRTTNEILPAITVSNSRSFPVSKYRRAGEEIKKYKEQTGSSK